MHEENTTEKNKKPPHAGHRARLMQKAKNERLCDSELLELLLFYAVPRRDTRNIAHALLSKCGTLRDVLRAESATLSEVDGVGENVTAFLKRLNELCLRYFGELSKPTSVSIKAKSEAFWKYLDAVYSSVDFEVVDVFLLDAESHIFSSCRLAEGDVKQVQFRPSMLSKILVETPPAGIIIIHNHPQGAPDPSPADREMTEKCQVLCSLHNVMFCDHIIYAKGQIFSFYDSGNLQSISLNYSIENIVRKKGENNV